MNTTLTSGAGNTWPSLFSLSHACRAHLAPHETTLNSGAGSVWPDTPCYAYGPGMPTPTWCTLHMAIDAQASGTGRTWQRSRHSLVSMHTHLAPHEHRPDLLRWQDLVGDPISSACHGLTPTLHMAIDAHASGAGMSWFLPSGETTRSVSSKSKAHTQPHLPPPPDAAEVRGALLRAASARSSGISAPAITRTGNAVALRAGSCRRGGAHAMRSCCGCGWWLCAALPAVALP